MMFASIRDVIIKKACKESFLRIAVRYNMVVRALEFGPDQVNLFLGNCKKYSVPQVAQYFKGASSRELRKKYMDRVKIRLWGDSFWSDGYFYESVGRVTSESIEYYIKRQQGKHWADEDFEVRKKHQSQKSLKDFFNIQESISTFSYPAAEIDKLISLSIQNYDVGYYIT